MFRAPLAINTVYTNWDDDPWSGWVYLFVRSESSGAVSDGRYNNYKLYYTIMLQFTREQGDIRISIVIVPRAFMNTGDYSDDRMETSGPKGFQC
jgi:hypothetical protein